MEINVDADRANRVRLAQLRVMLDEMRARDAQEQQQLAQQLEVVAPGALALVWQAVRAPNVNLRNMKQWFSEWWYRHPTAMDELTEELLIAMVTLAGMFMMSSQQSGAQLRPNPDTFVGPYNSGPWHTASCDGESVVDAVFAKAEDRARQR